METEIENSGLDKLVKVHLKIRDKIAELTQVFDTEHSRLKEQQTEIALALKDMLRAMGEGVNSVNTQYGTVKLATKKRYYFTDWEEADKFIIENQAPYLLERRVAQTKMQDFLEANPGVVPPGLSTSSELTVSVQKPRK